MCARAFRKNACDNAPSRWRVTYVFAICCAVMPALAAKLAQAA
jgi:hypothetical protein